MPDSKPWQVCTRCGGLLVDVEGMRSCSCAEQAWSPEVRADQLMYARQSEWSGGLANAWTGRWRLKLRDLIAREIRHAIEGVVTTSEGGEPIEVRMERGIDALIGHEFTQGNANAVRSLCQSAGRLRTLRETRHAKEIAAKDESHRLMESLSYCDACQGYYPHALVGMTTDGEQSCCDACKRADAKDAEIERLRADLRGWQERFDFVKAKLSGLKTPEQVRAEEDDARAPEDDERRCAVCGWRLVNDRMNGCVKGDCSERPRPDRLYAPERAVRDGYIRAPEDENGGRE